MSSAGRPSNDKRTARMDADRERKRRARAAQYAKRDPKEVAAKTAAAKESAARTAAERAAFDVREAKRKEAAAAKAAAAVRPVARFTTGAVVDGPSGSIIRNPEPLTLNPYQAPPRQEPYVPTMPPNAVRQILPSPRLPGVTYGANGTRTAAHGSGRSYSPFDF